MQRVTRSLVFFAISLMFDFNASAAESRGVVVENRDDKLATIKAKKEAADARAAHVKLVNSKPWSSQVKTAILQKKVIRGMIPEQAQLAWGKPQQINRSAYSFGVHEQWVYGGGSYLYFENDELTSFQDSR